MAKALNIDSNVILISLFLQYVYDVVILHWNTVNWYLWNHGGIILCQIKWKAVLQQFVDSNIQVSFVVSWQCNNSVKKKRSENKISIKANISWIKIKELPKIFFDSSQEIHTEKRKLLESIYYFCSKNLHKWYLTLDFLDLAIQFIAMSCSTGTLTTIPTRVKIKMATGQCSV